MIGIFKLLVISACTTDHTLEWNEGNGYRWAEIKLDNRTAIGFQKIDSKISNITFSNQLSDEWISKNQGFLNGSGVAVGDIDGSGLPDIYFASLDGPNKLYKNMGGFQFKDITEEAGLAHEGYYSTGVVFSDLNGNGHLDLIITSLNKYNSIYLNNGNGTFEFKKDSGLTKSYGSTTAAIADINGNGYPDLYITNYKYKSAKDLFGLNALHPGNTMIKTGNAYELLPPFDEHFTLIYDGNGVPDMRELGELDELYFNNGDGSFTKATNLKYHFLSSDGTPRGLSRDWGLASKFHDITNNGLPDLYVSNDFWTPDKVWINQGNGIFKEIENLAIRNFSFSSMAVDFSDINRDGYSDIFVTEMLSPNHEDRLKQQVSFDPFQSKMDSSGYRPLYSRNSLYLNRGDDTFAEIAYYSGVAATGWSWATRFLDVNLSGYEDIIINTGYLHDIQDLDTQRLLAQRMAQTGDSLKGYVLEFPSLELPNMVLRNNGNLTFTDKSSDWGFTEDDISHGLALADLDNDGDLDLVVNRMNKEAVIYKNITTAPRIAVRLIGESPNTRGIGSKAELFGGPVYQQKEMSATGDYLSSSDAMIVFAATAGAGHELKISWPTGKISRIDNVKANRVYEIYENSSRTAADLKINKIEPEKNSQLFLEDSQKIHHNHQISKFNDFELQPLLPARLNRKGAGISWFDFTLNGYDDLIITSGADYNLTVFENSGDGTLVHRKEHFLSNLSVDGLISTLFWNEQNYIRMVANISKSDENGYREQKVISFKITRDDIIEIDTLYNGNEVTGAIAAADYNGNGYVDIFVGNKFKLGEYPKNVSSQLYINDNGEFHPDKDNLEVFRDLEPVTDALFVDFNNNGLQDLLVSTEWGPLYLFLNENGKFREIGAEVGLNKYSGWWNSIAIGDFNNNGYPDIVAVNMGLNNPYRQKSKLPLRMFYDDFNANGITDIIEAHYEPTLQKYVPGRRLNDFASIPNIILRNVRSHSEFASASLQEILGIQLNEIPYKEINTLEHMLFLNNGDTFIAHSLPGKAQFSAAFSVGVADFDNDGNEDIFLGQNFFGYSKHIPRQDAGRGLVLKGDGRGNFKTI
ncbi:MAG: VCBS repeat-containing protein, partial [Balneolaceae bacterium]